MAEYQTIEHIFEPVFNEQSRILILGSLPSVKSRENHFYYGHPQNRFWKLIAALCHTEIPRTIEEKSSFYMIMELLSGMLLQGAILSAPVTALLKMWFPMICG